MVGPNCEVSMTTKGIICGQQFSISCATVISLSYLAGGRISQLLPHAIKHAPMGVKRGLPSILSSGIVRILQGNCLAEHAVARTSCFISCATLGASRGLNLVRERQN